MFETLDRRDETDEPIIEINTTPLIDVMLVLLITLIITIPIQTHAVKMDLPSAPNEQSAPTDVVMIDIAPDGVIRWNQESVAGTKDLEARLKEASGAAKPAEFHIHSDPHAPYRKMAELLSAMQRQGIRKFAIVSIP